MYLHFKVSGFTGTDPLGFAVGVGILVVAPEAVGALVVGAGAVIKNNRFPVSLHICSCTSTCLTHVHVHVHVH